MDIKIITDYADYTSYLKIVPGLIRGATVTSLNQTIRSVRANST